MRSRSRRARAFATSASCNTRPRRRRVASRVSQPVPAARMSLEFEVHAGEPGGVADRELLLVAETVDLRERQLGIEASVLEPALAHRVRGLRIDALGADRHADRADD